MDFGRRDPKSEWQQNLNNRLSLFSQEIHLNIKTSSLAWSGFLRGLLNIGKELCRQLC